MRHRILLCCAGVVACISPVGCADYPESKTQRPVYSHENVEIGQTDSGYEYRTKEIEKERRE